MGEEIRSCGLVLPRHGSLSQVSSLLWSSQRILAREKDLLHLLTDGICKTGSLTQAVSFFLCVGAAWSYVVNFLKRTVWPVQMRNIGGVFSIELRIKMIGQDALRPPANPQASGS
jgi:hypothetical protein